MEEQRREKLNKDFEELKKVLKNYCGRSTKIQLEALIEEIYFMDELDVTDVMEHLASLVQENIDAA